MLKDLESLVLMVFRLCFFLVEDSDCVKSTTLNPKP